jgi:hypothetical protein
LNLLAEHDYEPMPGLPGPLPEGEYIRWQGRPDWRDLAISALHVRKIAIYFAILLALRVGFELKGGAEMASIVKSTAALGALALLAVGLLCLLAWLMARASLYTITNRRIVIRGGVALPITVNLPFSKVVSADFRSRRHGFGDLPVKLQADTQASWTILWPHVRPWHIGRVQPMLRSVADAEEAATILADALRTNAQQSNVVEMPPRVTREDTFQAAGAGAR